jgi:hypothetical protein
MQHKAPTKAYMCRQNLLDSEPVRQRIVQRENGIGALTNRPKKVVAPEGYGIPHRGPSPAAQRPAALHSSIGLKGRRF